MAPKVVVLQHVAMETPARVAHAAARAGLQVQTVRLFDGAAVPRVDLTDVLVVMGGPMGVGDVEAFPFLADELCLLKERVAASAPTLGICLGAQLVAHAAGARVFPNAQLELGWGPVHFINHEAEPVLAGLGDQQNVLHWHGDTFDLPPGAVQLASTAVCTNQAFRLGTKLFGLQFHCEAEPEMIDVWLKEDAAYVLRARGLDGDELVRAETAAVAEDDRRKGDRLLDNIFASMLAR